MKKARDSFYVALRDRLQAINPTRQILIRGVWRPGVLVEENESFAATVPDDVFVLRWTSSLADTQHALPQIQQTCEVHYQSAGTAAAGGMDRGVLLATMDAELLSIMHPQQIQKTDYSVTPPMAMGTRVFWTTPMFTPVIRERDRIIRKAEITTMSYVEAGEL